MLFRSPGDYTYRTTFDLSAYDAANTVVCGQWTSDNGGVNILINGTPTGHTASGDYGVFFPFLIDSGFVAGVNTLDFVVRNDDAVAGYIGLRVTDLLHSEWMSKRDGERRRSSAKPPVIIGNWHDHRRI